MTGENRFRRAMHVRDALRRERLSSHTWESSEWHGRNVMVCSTCGYVWKPDLVRPTQDCRRPGNADDGEGGSDDVNAC